MKKFDVGTNSHKIRVLLAKAGMTQAELAQRLGITPQAVANMLSSCGDERFVRIKKAIRYKLRERMEKGTIHGEGGER